MWNHPLFTSPEFLRFKESQKNYVENAVDPLSVSLESLLPELSTEIRMNREFSMRIINELQRLTELVQSQQEELQQRGQATATSSQPQRPNPMGRTKMKRDISMTVENLWEEWTIGLDGNPSIRDLEVSTRKKWRSGDKTENKYFERRKVIIDAVQALINGGTEEASAVSTIEERRGTMTLNQFYKELQRTRTGSQQPQVEESEQ
jgi:hypothetical protein